MNKTEYLDAFDENRARILEMASLGFDAQVRGCPGWDVGALLGHVAGVYMFWAKWINQRPSPPSKSAREELMEERDRRMPGFRHWMQNGWDSSARPSGLLAGAKTLGDELSAMLGDLSPGEPVWTFYEPDQTAGFIQRRIAHETTIHRWDAEQAHGEQEVVRDDLALDGIDEYLTIALPPSDSTSENQEAVPSFRFVPHGGQSAWFVQLDAGHTTVSTQGQDADVTVTGSCSDILLFLWGRLGPEDLEITGSIESARQWNKIGGRF